MSARGNLRIFCFLPWILLVYFGRLPGQVRLPKVFGDHMVLQQGMAVPVWGWARPGEEIRVSLGEARAKARADARGRWRAYLPALRPGAPRDLLVEGKSGSRRFRDVLVGEVWLCSGQSNMEMGIRLVKDAEKEIGQARYPEIRLFLVPRKTSPEAEEDVEASWEVCSPETIVHGGWGGFSACAYFFGRKLHRTLKVPVGLIESCWGGSRIEAWTPPEGFSLVPNLRGPARMVWSRTPGTKAYRERYQAFLEATRAWLKRAEAALREGRSVPEPPAPPAVLPQGRKGITGLYDGMIHPLLPFAIRGAIWYQGEANNGDGRLYFKKMQALTRGWRKLWGEGNFPFYFVQIAPYRYGGSLTPLDLPELWEAQAEAARKIPAAGMARTQDIGNLTNIHPRNKQEVGRRLALLALARTYGRKVQAGPGPSFRSVEFRDGAALVRFDHCGGGLVSRDGKPLRGFEAAGEDRVYRKARARIVGEDAVLVRCGKVADPRFVRFAWRQDATPNLADREGFPAYPFRSDQGDYEIPPGPNLAWGRPYRSSDPNRKGYGRGGALTDGSWRAESAHCYATGKSPRFPKWVTVDLGKARPIAAVRFGTPPFGSTRTLAVELSPGGKRFTRVGVRVSPFGRAGKWVLRFPPVKARFVRVVFLDRYDRKKGYDRNYMFLTELEVYPQVRGDRP